MVTNKYYKKLFEYYHCLFKINHKYVIVIHDVCLKASALC